jgi:septum formation protein
MRAEHIYLAAHDTQRAELLARIGVPFELLRFRNGERADLEVSDGVVAGETPLEHVHRVALARAMGGVRRIVLRHLTHSAVLACATVIDLDGETLVRPAKPETAAQILRKLSGRTHRVISCVVLADQERSSEAVSASEVRFVRLSEQSIERCVRAGIAADEPGAYSLLGPAAAYIQHVQGSCSGIMGLPLHETAALLSRFGSAP